LFKSVFKSMFLIALVGLIILEPADRRKTVANVASNGLHVASQLLVSIANRIDPDPQFAEPLVPTIAPRIPADPDA